MKERDTGNKKTEKGKSKSGVTDRGEGLADEGKTGETHRWETIRLRPDGVRPCR